MHKIWTIGHSTRTIEDFISLLKQNEIEVLADVRAFPGSRRLPHFNKENLETALEKAGIEYYHFKQLGGRRKPDKESKNIAWKHPAFRAYADYMETPDFKQAIEDLIELAKEKNTAYMCAEVLWFRCHRSLISDYLKSIGFEVIHIMGTSKNQVHPYTSAANIIDGKLSYKGLF